MECKEKFLSDWKTLFPGADLPDLNFFESKVNLEKEFLQTEKRVSSLKIKLQKEEFILKTLKKLKEDKSIQNSFNRKSLTAAEDLSPTGQLISISDQIFSPKIDLNSSGNESVFTPSSFSSFMPRSASKSSLNNPDQRGEPKHSKSMSLDESHLVIRPKPHRRLTNPEPVSANPEPPKRDAKSLPRDSREIAIVDQRKVSLDSSRATLNVLNKELRLKMTQSADFSELSSPIMEPVAAVRKSVQVQERVACESSSDEDHIYTDISEFKKPLPTPPIKTEPDNHEMLENQAQLYENAFMKPVLEKINDSNDEDTASPRSPSTRERKRLGSEDRQAQVFSEDLDVTNEEINSYNHETINVHGSQESLVDAIQGQDSPQIVIQSDDDFYDDDYDDDEHIYANVDEICKQRKDSDSGSDQEGLLDSMSAGIPSPNYREMTMDEMILLQKKRESDDDGTYQDDSDSDELNQPEETETTLNRNRTNANSAVVRSNVPKPPVPAKARTASSPVKQKTGNNFPSQHHDSEEDDKNLKASRLRKFLASDLLDSEKRYYDCLEMLLKFMKPLQMSTESSQPILSQADFKSIFHQAEELFTMHRQFLFALEPRIEHWNDGTLIGDLFIMIMHGFHIYSSYIGNYTNAMDTLKKCMAANQQFALIMDKDIKIISAKDPLTISGLLYKPIDRMTQYSLILNDLLKYTPPDHPDHPLIVEVSGELFDLFDQVNIDSSKKKRRQRQLLKEAFVVEIDDGERRPRSLILFNDVIISAKLKQANNAFMLKWYASLCDINLKPFENSESPQVVPVSAKSECDKIRANIANLRQEIRKEHMPLQQTISMEASPPFVKRRNVQGPRSSSRAIEKIKKKIGEQERFLQLISPNIPFNLYHSNGKTYTLLIAVEADRQAWIEALKPRLKRIHARQTEPIQLSSLELQQAFETVLKLQRLGTRFGAQLPSPFLGPTRPMSMDFSKFDEDKESLTGYLYINIDQGKGFHKNSDTYVILEIDSYGHFFKKARTKTARGSDPQWDEAFEFEIEACNCLRLTCYNRLRLMGDDICGKVNVNLTRENLVNGKNRAINVVLDRGQAMMNISLCFSTSIDGIQKTPSISRTGVFGLPISVVCSREKCDIPVVVISCLKEIEKRGMNEVGIYRLSGVASEIQNVKKLFNEQTQSAVLVLPETDIHAVAGVLKLYFRELPQSLFTSKLYHKFVEGFSISDPEEKELYMCDILHQLPRVNKMTALYLLEHLRRVVLLESENKMGVNNLATVFGPTVLRPPSSSSDKENERSSCNIGSFDIGALDVMSQVGIFRYFLGLKNNERTKLPKDDLELWRRLDSEKAAKLEEKLLQSAEEFLI